MKVLHVIDGHTSDEIKEQIKGYPGYNDVIDWKIIQCVKANPGIQAKLISQVYCISIQKVYGVIEKYNKSGNNFKQGIHWGGRREDTAYLSLEEEKEFLVQLQERAVQGLILTAMDIKGEIESKVNHPVSLDYIWKIFKRHNWTKKAPRPEHPKTDYEKQEEFKKNFLRIWQPPN